MLRDVNGVSCAIIGQAFPYTPIANPRYMVADWSFGIQDENMQKVVDEARAKGAKVVVVLSHNGMDVDLRWPAGCAASTPSLAATRMTACRWPFRWPMGAARPWSLNAGSNSKFLGVMDFDVQGGKVADFRYRLLPVFANALPADREMDALITKVRAPYEAKLAEKLAVTDGLLYRRGNFNGSWDQLICDALIDVQGADLSFSPGFRWGTSLLPGDTITRELLMDQLAITYPYATLTHHDRRDHQDGAGRRGRQPVQPRPVLPAGRRHGACGRLQYTCNAGRKGRQPHQRHALAGKPVEAGKNYKVAGWAPVAEEGAHAAGCAAGVGTGGDLAKDPSAQAQGGRIKPAPLNTPKLVGRGRQPGYAGLNEFHLSPCMSGVERLFGELTMRLRPFFLLLAATVPAAFAAADAPWVADARSVATAMPPKLLKVLTDEITANGPESAISVCRDKAPQMAKAASEQSGWQVRRVSLNNRNPKAQPDAWEQAHTGRL